MCGARVAVAQTEQIRRANRLFAQDSLFLRQYLMIPVDRNASVASDDHPMDAAPSTSHHGASSSKANRNKNDDIGRSINIFLLLLLLRYYYWLQIKYSQLLGRIFTLLIILSI